MAVGSQSHSLRTATGPNEDAPCHHLTISDCAKPDWSILNATLLDLQNVDDQVRDAIWTEAGTKALSCLELNDTDSRILRAAGMSLDDGLDCLIPLTVGYLLRLRLGASTFAKLIDTVAALVDACGGVSRVDEDPEASRVPVLQRHNVEALCGLRIDAFDVPDDIVERMRGMGIDTWAHLDGVSERDALSVSGGGIEGFLRVSDLWWLRDYANEALKIVAPLQIGAEDGFADVIEALIAEAAYRPNDRIVFLGRIGLLEGRRWTLEELGERLDLSRERIRQIEQKVRTRLEARPHRECFDAIRWAVFQVLRTSGGVCTYEELARGLCALLRWGRAPLTSALERFLLSFDICECDRTEELASDPFHRCLNCCVARSTLDALLSDRCFERPLAELAVGLSQGCEDTAACGGDRMLPKFSHGYVQRLLASASGFVVDDATVYSRDVWRVRNGSRGALVESILRNAGRPMHFRDVYDEARAVLPEGEALTPHSIHALLGGSDSVLLWDRGTFVYAEAVSVPQALLTRVETWLVEKLSGAVPFVTVSGAFTQFQDQCTAQGVTSETALYTCLRKSGNTCLIYPKYPQVYLAEAFESRVPALVAIEQHIRDAGREVAREELTEYALSDLCLKEFQFQQCLAQLSGILRTAQGGFIDASLVRIDQARLEEFKDELLKMVGREGHISVTRVFDGKRVTCRMMGVGSPEMLYSVLRDCDFMELELRAYPRISVASKKGRSGQARSVMADVVAYIQRKSAPVSFAELEDKYVEELGYREQTVHAAAFAEGVLRYGQGSVVHQETLAWSDERQVLLERAALAIIERSRERGWVHGLASDMIEGGGLPDLAGGVPWTQTLVGELLSLGKRFRLVGNARNAFVAIPNREGIQSLDDLAARLLRLEFDGASDVASFEERLRAVGVIKGRLAGAKLGEASRVVVTDHLVLLRELADRAQ